jgi:hypothetical protein
MTDEEYEHALKVHAQHMEERKALTDAARESTRTFDQAVLAFGAAVFGASVAFLKDVAPKPLPCSLFWLCISWSCFTLGLLAVILSFLFSHRACMARIDEGAARLNAPPAKSDEKSSDEKTRKDPWGMLTNVCNYSCIGFLFVGVVAWIVFALENLAKSGVK